LVVSTAYHEQHSATAIIGTIIFDTVTAMRVPVLSPSSRSRMAHWAMKHSSAMVASERPTPTLDSHESSRQMRCTSARGNTERKPHTITNTADSASCVRRSE